MKQIKDINLIFFLHHLFGHFFFCPQNHAWTEYAKIDEEGFLIMENLHL